MLYIPNICPDCGGSLDPGEVCDCQRSNDELAEYLKEGDGNGGET